MCRGSEAGSYLRLIHFVYHSTLGLRVIKKKKKHLHAVRLQSRLVEVSGLGLEQTTRSRDSLGSGESKGGLQHRLDRVSIGFQGWIGLGFALRVKRALGCGV